jgi:hypothetical protein
MNNRSNNNKNTLCSYIILTLPLNKKGILQQHHARERGLYHQQHQVGERTTSSISSWNIDWRIYKSSGVFFTGIIVILKGMQSSSASICISVKLIHHHHHHNTRLAHHNNTRRFTSQLSSRKHSSSLISSSCFTSQLSNWKQDARPTLCHNHQVGSRILDWIYVTAIQPKSQC